MAQTSYVHAGTFDTIRILFSNLELPRPSLFNISHYNTDNTEVSQTYQPKPRVRLKGTLAKLVDVNIGAYLGAELVCEVKTFLALTPEKESTRERAPRKMSIETRFYLSSNEDRPSVSSRNIKFINSVLSSDAWKDKSSLNHGSKSGHAERM